MAIAGFEDERESPSKESRQPLEVGKDKKTDSPLEPPERNAILVTPSY